MAGNANSGRFKLPETLLKELNLKINRHSDELIDKMIDKALVQGDKDCLMRLFNHIFGLPRQTQDIEIKQSASFSPDQLAALRKYTISILSNPDAPIIDAEVKELPPGPDGTTPDTPQSDNVIGDTSD